MTDPSGPPDPSEPADPSGRSESAEDRHREDEFAEPTPEQVELRARNADKATRRALAAILGLEALVVLLVPRAIAFTDAGLGGTKTGLLLGLAGLMVVGAAFQRRAWGIGFGSALQVPLI